MAYGEAARTEAAESMRTLRLWNDWPVTVIGESVIGADCIEFPQADPGGRWAKVNLDQLAPYARTLYIDADTRVRGSLQAGFDILDDGFDLVISASRNQGDDLLWHVGEEEREMTLQEVHTFPLQLQAGVFFFRKSAAIRRLFAAWRSEWLRWKGQDQAALLRALVVAPVRMWLMGTPWNGGALIEHRFGRVRERH